MVRKLMITGILLLSSLAAQAEPVRVWRTNPRYFEFQGKPLVLLTTDHHYGAVIDRDFDFARYLDYLGRAGMNLTRIYPGGMFEPPDKYLKGNPLGPRAGRQILPWARSGKSGAHPQLGEPGHPSYKFDLDRWDPEYFSRLKAYVKLAAKKGIIVEIAFFNGMYEDSWPLNALYHGNNIQGAGGYEASECGLFTTGDPRNRDVLRYQKSYVVKLTEELNEFENVIFDLCDEPSLHGKPDGSVLHVADEKVIPWLLELKDAFLEAEARLPKKHLLGQTAISLSPDLSREDWCEWVPVEYVRPAATALEKDCDVRKPFLNVESDYYGFGLTKPYTIDQVRAEGWWFMLRGGAGTISLNGEFFRGQETGSKNTRGQIAPQRRALRRFMERFDLAGIEAFPGLGSVPADTIAAAIAEPGKQYGLYLCHGKPGPHHFVTVRGSYRDSMVFKAVPAGTYRLRWFDPATGSRRGEAMVTWKGGDMEIKTPAYELDIALRINRSGQ